MTKIIVIVHDVRSTHNVGSILRTAEGMGVECVYLTGYTPYPHAQNDTRLPHIASKLATQIHKTALNAESLIRWEHTDDVGALIRWVKSEGYALIALEQSPGSVSLPEYHSPEKVALLLGREVEGISQELLKQCDQMVEIPMFGKKESFNVVQATAMALYQFRFG